MGTLKLHSAWPMNENNIVKDATSSLSSNKRCCTSTEQQVFFSPFTRGCMVKSKKICHN